MQGIEYIVYYILDTFYPWSNQLIAPLKHHCLSLLINEMEKWSYLGNEDLSPNEFQPNTALSKM